MESLNFRGESASLALVRAFVTRLLAETALDARTRHHVLLAVDEAVSSLIANLNGERAEGRFTLHLDLSDERVRVVIDDHVVRFEGHYPTKESLREAFRRAKSKELSVYLLRAVMDEIRYVYRAGQENQLEMVKYLPGVALP